MSRRWPRIGTALLAAAIACSPPGQQLRIELQPGDRQRFVLTQSQQTEMDLGSLGRQRGATSARYEVTQTVTGRDADGSLTVETTYDRLVLELDLPGSSLRLDTAGAPPADAQSPLAVARRLLVGRKLSVRLSNRGEVVAVTGLDDLQEDLQHESRRDPALRPTAEALQESLGAQQTLSLMQQRSLVFPEKPIRRGDTWSAVQQVSNPLIGTLEVWSTYRLEGVETRHGRDCLRIGVATSVRFAGAEILVDRIEALFGQQGADVETEWDTGRNAGRGTAWIDEATGLTVGSELEQDLEVKLKLRISRQGEIRVMEMLASTKHRTRLELLD
jgi:hypothetical protein